MDLDLGQDPEEADFLCLPLSRLEASINLDPQPLAKP